MAYLIIIVTDYRDAVMAYLIIIVTDYYVEWPCRFGYT